MSRYAKIIPMDEFQKKAQKILESDDFPYDLSTKIETDLKKVNFDRENYEFKTGEGYNNYPCGFETLENGLPVLFMNAGGDWENPICFCLYWDGKSLRGYIPEDGNVYNKKHKCAYGSEDLDDESVDYDNLPNGDADAIRKDVMARILIK
jgi:hypothetical protein